MVHCKTPQKTIRIMSQHTTHPIVFCALVRDCHKRLKHHETNFKKLERHFPNAHWVFVENDSKDRTRSYLEQWQRRNPNVTILGSNTGELTIPLSRPETRVIPGYSLHRIERMAHFRNLYIEWMESHLPNQHNGSVIILDPDVKSLPIRKIIYWAKHLNQQQAITALGLSWISPRKMRFHDAFAYRPLLDSSPQTLEIIQNRRLELANYFVGSKLSAVRSNFNGLGIYPLSALYGCRYMALPNPDDQVEAECEHIPFHDQLANKNVTIYLDPTLRIIYNSWLAVTSGTHRARIKRWMVSLFNPSLNQTT